MKSLFAKIGITALLALLLLSGCFYLVMANSRIHPENYVGSLVTDPATYSTLETIDAKDLRDRLYHYQKSECVAAISKQRLMPNTVDGQNLVPALKCDDDIFIITHKWVNFSRGLAISNDETFVTKLQAADPGLSAWQLRDNVYGWDLERDRAKLDR